MLKKIQCFSNNVDNFLFQKVLVWIKKYNISYLSFSELHFHDRALAFMNDIDLKDIFGENRGDMSIFRSTLDDHLNGSQPSASEATTTDHNSKKTADDDSIFYQDVHESIVSAI